MTQQPINPRQEFDSSQGQLNSSSNTTSKTPPVFTGFKIFQNNSDGFFIYNPADGSIFKWINTRALRCNGRFEGSKNQSRAGRRNFQGRVWDCFRDRGDNWIGYTETDDLPFRRCTRHFGGFYISVYRARVSKDGKINYSGKGAKVQMVNFFEAKENALKYEVEYAKNREFISVLPCGAAMDCVSEEIFERFEKRVKAAKQSDESMYEAWNRYEKGVRPILKQNGIYGIHDLINLDGSEITSEAFNNIHYQCAVRGGARGLFLISHGEWEEQPEDCYFEIGNRNFISSNARFLDYGHRVVLLPQGN